MFQVPLAGYALSSANVNIETNISSTNASIGNISATNGTISNLTTTIFNPTNVNSVTVNTDNLVVTNSVALLNVSVLNVSEKHVSQLNASNISAGNISATSITADNIQPLLIAGQNISIVDNTISAINDALLPANVNFSDVNTSSFETGTLSSTGYAYLNNVFLSNDLIGGNVYADNISTGSLSFGSGLSLVNDELDVNVTAAITSGSTLPITSGAVYNAINMSNSNLQQTYMFNGTGTNGATVHNFTINAGQQLDSFSVTYYPKFEGSRITVQACWNYSVSGTGADNVVTYLRTGITNDTVNIVSGAFTQKWVNSGGGGTRSPAGSLQGTYTNSDTVGAFHRTYIQIDNNTDDTYSLLQTAYISVMVTESLDISTSAGQNVRIGSGNMSCTNSSAVQGSFSNSLVCSNASVQLGYMDIDNRFGNSITIAHKDFTSGNDYSYSIGDDATNYINSPAAQKLLFRNGNINIMRMDNTGLAINLNRSDGSRIPQAELEISGNISVDGNLLATGNVSCEFLYVNNDATITDDLVVYGDTLIETLLVNSTAIFTDTVTVQANNPLVVQGNASILNLSCFNLSISGSITGINFSTASLIPGSNITIVNDVISAFVGGDAELNISSLHIDNDADIFGTLNVSETSTFSESLNVCNILYLGKAGQHDGQQVIYSQTVGNNYTTNYIGDNVSIQATGLTAAINTSLGGNNILQIQPNDIHVAGNLHVSGTLSATFLDTSFDDLYMVNLSVTGNASLNLASVTTLEVISELEIDDAVNAGEYSTIYRTANQTYIQGKNASAGSSIILRSGNTTSGLVVDTNNITTITQLNVVQSTGLVNVSLDGNMSVMTGTIETLNLSATNISTLLLSSDDVNAQLVNTSNLSAITGDITNLSNTNFSTINVSATAISATTISTTTITAVTSLNVPTINASTVNASDINSELFNTSNLSADVGDITNLSNTNLSTGSVTATSLSATTISGTNITASTAITAPTINTSTINASDVIGIDIYSTTINTSNINASIMTVLDINVSDIGAVNVECINLFSDTILSEEGTIYELTATNLSTATINTSTINCSTIATTGSCTFGTALISGIDCAAPGSFAQFGHVSRCAVTDYSFLSQSNGDTFVNCTETEQIRLRANNVDRLIVENVGCTLKGATVVSGDLNCGDVYASLVDSTVISATTSVVTNMSVTNLSATNFDFVLGAINTSTDVNVSADINCTGALTVSENSTISSAFVGNYTSNSNYAQFSHINRSSGSTDFSFHSQSAGGTFINSRTGYKTYIKVNNVDVVTVDNTSLIVTGAIETSERSIFDGTAIIGQRDSGGSAYAQFSHKDRNSDTDYSFLSGTNGNTWVNAKSGKGIYIRTNNQDRMIVGDDNVTFSKRIILGSMSAVAVGTYLGFQNQGHHMDCWTNGGSGYKFYINYYAQKNVILNRTEYASDERIKEDIVNADGAVALELFNRIEFKKYKYKTRPNDGLVYGVIAQQLKTVVPNMVSLSDLAIPNINVLAQVTGDLFVLASGSTALLVVDEVVQIMNPTSYALDDVKVIEIIDNTSFRIDKEIKLTEMKVVGTIVDDFHTIDKNQLYMLTSTAVKEIDSQLQAEKVKTLALETQLASVLLRLEELEK